MEKTWIRLNSSPFFFFLFSFFFLVFFFPFRISNIWFVIVKFLEKLLISNNTTKIRAEGFKVDQFVPAFEILFFLDLIIPFPNFLVDPFNLSAVPSGRTTRYDGIFFKHDSLDWICGRKWDCSIELYPTFMSPQLISVPSRTLTNLLLSVALDLPFIYAASPTENPGVQLLHTFFAHLKANAKEFPSGTFFLYDLFQKVLFFSLLLFIPTLESGLFFFSGSK